MTELDFAEAVAIGNIVRIVTEYSGARAIVVGEITRHTFNQSGLESITVFFDDVRRRLACDEIVEVIVYERYAFWAKEDKK